MPGIASKLKSRLAELAMDQPSRMARAKEGGFMTGMPLYHGTARDIQEFSLGRGGEVSRSPVGKLGVSLATDPDTASEFANLAGSEGANVIQAYHRASKPVRIELQGDELNHEIAATVQDAWDQGFDAIKFDNYTTPGGEKGRSFVLVKDPSQVRSVHAQFDPEKRSSADLMASILPAGLGVGTLLPQESEAKDSRLAQLARPDIGSIQAIDGNPKALKLAEMMRRYSDTPIGPFLGGTADVVEKFGWGQKRSLADYMKAGLDYLR